MRTDIHTRFATAEDTAHVLGVPRSRLKKLMRLATSMLRKETAGQAVAHRERNGDTARTIQVHHKASESKPKATGKNRVSSRRRGSGKAAKSTR
jgi:hypothetical protein